MRKLHWKGPPLRQQCEADAREAARRKGSPLPPSAPKIQLTRRRADDERISSARRRIVTRTGSD